MARRFTTWGGIRINTNKTPEQIVNQLNRQNRQMVGTKDSFDRKLDVNMRVGNSTALNRYGIEYDNELGDFYLNRKGQLNSQTPIAAMGGTNG